MSYDSELLAKLLARPDLKTVNEKDKNGWTPLMFSVQLNATRFVRLLMMDDRVDPNIRDNQGNSPLMAAVMLNHVGSVNLILSDARADLSERSKYKRSDGDVARYEQQLFLTIHIFTLIFLTKFSKKMLRIVEEQKSTVSEMLEDLVQDDTSHLSKLDKVWEQVVKSIIIKELVDHWREVAKLGKTLEEAARWNLPCCLAFIFRTPCDGTEYDKCDCGSAQGHPYLARLVEEEKRRRRANLHT